MEKHYNLGGHKKIADLIQERIDSVNRKQEEDREQEKILVQQLKQQRQQNQRSEETKENSNFTKKSSSPMNTDLKKKISNPMENTDGNSDHFNSLEPGNSAPSNFSEMDLPFSMDIPPSSPTLLDRFKTKLDMASALCTYKTAYYFHSFSLITQRLLFREKNAYSSCNCDLIS
jgi:hypothetical protein